MPELLMRNMTADRLLPPCIKMPWLDLPFQCDRAIDRIPFGSQEYCFENIETRLERTCNIIQVLREQWAGACLSLGQCRFYHSLTCEDIKAAWEKFHFVSENQFAMGHRICLVQFLAFDILSESSNLIHRRNICVLRPMSRTASFIKRCGDISIPLLENPLLTWLLIWIQKRFSIRISKELERVHSQKF
jgi:hypothetical protein